MDQKTFTYVSYIKTTPEELWAALTSADFTSQYWFGLKIQSDWQLDSDVTLLNEDGTVAISGKVLKADRPNILSYTFHAKAKPEWIAEAPTRVTFELNVDGALVCLNVTHDKFTDDSTVYLGISKGWPAILSSLKSLLETGKPLAFD
jgi:uncharacterized protein YndB with AHSA1/START domain